MTGTSVETLEERVTKPAFEDDEAVAPRPVCGPMAPSCRKAKLSIYLGLVRLDGLGGGVDRLSRCDD